VEKKVFALFLSRGTPTNEAAIPVLEKYKVPLIGPSTGAMSMYEPPRKYLFRCVPATAPRLFKVVDQLVQHGDQEDRRGVHRRFIRQGRLTGVQQAMKEKNIAPVAVANHPREPQKSRRRSATIAKAEPQAVIMTVLADAGVAFVKQLKKTGQSPLFITLSNNSSNAFIKNLGEDGPGVGVSQVSPYPFSATIPIVKEFQDAISRSKDVAARMPPWRDSSPPRSCRGLEARRPEADAGKADHGPRI